VPLPHSFTRTYVTFTHDGGRVGAFLAFPAIVGTTAQYNEAKPKHQQEEEKKKKQHQRPAAV
jgi:hypothetical protein